MSILLCQVIEDQSMIITATSITANFAWNVEQSIAFKSRVGEEDEKKRKLN